MYRKIKINGIKFKKKLTIIKKDNLTLEIDENLSKEINNLSVSENDANHNVNSDNISENDDEHTVTIYIVYIVNTSYLMLHSNAPYTYNPIINDGFKYKKNIKNTLNTLLNIKNENISHIKLLETIGNNHIYTAYIKNKVLPMKPLFRLPYSKKDFYKNYIHNDKVYNLNINKLFRLIEHESKQY